MAAGLTPQPLDLPAHVERVLNQFVRAAGQAFGSQLGSVVLYGSAAEGRLRATSDVNVILVLSNFEPSSVEALRPHLEVARAAIQLRPMFLTEDEILAIVEAFPQKFADIRRRRRVLFGSDPFASVQVPRAAELFQLRQALMNQRLRLRAVYALAGAREEQMILALANAAGPLRSCASSLLSLAGVPAPSPRDALEQIAREAGAEFADAARHLSQARRERSLAPGVAASALLRLITLAGRMHARAQALS